MLTGKLSKAFLDDVQEGLAVSVTDMEVYGQGTQDVPQEAQMSHGPVAGRAGVLDEPVNQSIGGYLYCSMDICEVFFLISIFLCADSLPVGSLESCIHEASFIIWTAFVTIFPFFSYLILSTYLIFGTSLILILSSGSQPSRHDSIK